MRILDLREDDDVRILLKIPIKKLELSSTRQDRQRGYLKLQVEQRLSDKSQTQGK
jgi:hypothetical protein